MSYHKKGWSYDQPFLLISPQISYKLFIDDGFLIIKVDEGVKSLNLVTPAKAGVQKCLKLLDSGSSPE